MTETLYLVLLCAPTIVFFIAMLLYATLFRWGKSFQGRSMMGILGALNVILILNASYTLSYRITGVMQPWWIYASMAAFAILTIAGIGFCITIIRSRQRHPKA